MLRCTIEMVPKGDDSKAYPLGLIEIALQEVDEKNQGTYKVVLKKCVPFKGALKHAWKTGTMLIGHEDEEIIVGGVVGHHRAKRGVYDLLYRALVACGVATRNSQDTIELSEYKLLYDELAKWVRDQAKEDCRDCDGTGIFAGNVCLCPCVIFGEKP